MIMSGWRCIRGTNGIVCNPNIPSEEVFTTPHASRVSGEVAQPNLYLIKEHY